MRKHITGTRKEWLAARLELIEAEKEIDLRLLGATANSIEKEECNEFDKG